MYARLLRSWPQTRYDLQRMKPVELKAYGMVRGRLRRLQGVDHHQGSSGRRSHDSNHRRVYPSDAQSSPLQLPTMDSRLQQMMGGAGPGGMGGVAPGSDVQVPDKYAYLSLWRTSFNRD